MEIGPWYKPLVRLFHRMVAPYQCLHEVYICCFTAQHGDCIAVMNRASLRSSGRTTPLNDPPLTSTRLTVLLLGTLFTHRKGRK